MPLHSPHGLHVVCTPAAGHACHAELSPTPASRAAIAPGRPGRRSDGTGTCHALASRPGISTTTHKLGGGIMTETERPSTLTGHTNVREAEDFDSVYMQGIPPWDIGRSQPAFAELAE